MSEELKHTYDERFYARQKAGSLNSAGIVLEHVLPLLGAVRTVADIGCGAGGWLRTISDLIEDVEICGVDHPDVPKSTLYISADHFYGRDLSSDFDLKRKFDLVVSLEVAEHIPHQKLDVYLGNLTRHGDLILFSAAIPYQGGVGHINEQWPEYWTTAFSKFGFEVHDIIRPLIWDDERVAFWYRQNIMLFARKGARSFDDYESWGARSLVHPTPWLKRNKPMRAKLAQRLRAPFDRFFRTGG